MSVVLRSTWSSILKDDPDSKVDYLTRQTAFLSFREVVGSHYITHNPQSRSVLGMAFRDASGATESFKSHCILQDT